jgi:starch synthase
MNVLFVTAEMAPLVKVGGLADVAGALPRALRRLGLDVRVALPLYGTIPSEWRSAHRMVAVVLDGGVVWEAIVDEMTVYLVEHEESFDRHQIYGYTDDAERFLNFCSAMVHVADLLDWQPDVIHLNDWHGGFLPMSLALEKDHPWTSTPRVLTIHNLGHRGEITDALAREHALVLATSEGLANDVERSALAQAILSSHAINAVSPTYAQEILTPEFGGDLAPLLRLQEDRLTGILNGIDTEVFDPASDRHLAARFDADHLDTRLENKRALQRRLSLEADDDIPLIGMVTRLFEQKGTDLVPQALGPMLESGKVQLAVLGQGDPDHERMLAELASKHPGRAAIELAFDEPLGQLIYGGSDMFLMPSRYEPCGLGQMIAMRYGSIPVVRRTGGLADSVPAYDVSTDTGTGFVFFEATSDALATALRQALAVYRDKRAWRKLQHRAMDQDVSWERSAIDYQKMYERAIAAVVETRPVSR